MAMITLTNTGGIHILQTEDYIWKMRDNIKARLNIQDSKTFLFEAFRESKVEMLILIFFRLYSF